MSTVGASPMNLSNLLGGSPMNLSNLISPSPMAVNKMIGSETQANSMLPTCLPNMTPNVRDSPSLESESFPSSPTTADLGFFDPKFSWNQNTAKSILADHLQQCNRTSPIQGALQQIMSYPFEWQHNLLAVQAARKSLEIQSTYLQLLELQHLTRNSLTSRPSSMGGLEQLSNACAAIQSQSFEHIPKNGGDHDTNSKTSSDRTEAASAVNPATPPPQLSPTPSHAHKLDFSLQAVVDRHDPHRVVGCKTPPGCSSGHQAAEAQPASAKKPRRASTASAAPAAAAVAAGAAGTGKNSKYCHFCQHKKAYIVPCGGADCAFSFCKHCIGVHMGESYDVALRRSQEGSWMCPCCRNQCCCCSLELCKRDHPHCQAYRKRMLFIGLPVQGRPASAPAEAKQ